MVNVEKSVMLLFRGSISLILKVNALQSDDCYYIFTNTKNLNQIGVVTFAHD